MLEGDYPTAQQRAATLLKVCSDRSKQWPEAVGSVCQHGVSPRSIGDYSSFEPQLLCLVRDGEQQATSGWSRSFRSDWGEHDGSVVGGGLDLVLLPGGAPAAQGCDVEIVEPLGEREDGGVYRARGRSA